MKFRLLGYVHEKVLSAGSGAHSGVAGATLAAFRIKRGERVKRKKGNTLRCIPPPEPAKVYSILSRRRNAARGALYFFRVGGAFFH